MADLRDLNTTLARIDAGQARSKGFYPHRFRVDDQMTLATGLAWNDS